jgi:hypothetical protein
MDLPCATEPAWPWSSAMECALMPWNTEGRLVTGPLGVVVNTEAPRC